MCQMSTFPAGTWLHDRTVARVAHPGRGGRGSEPRAFDTEHPARGWPRHSPLRHGERPFGREQTWGFPDDDLGLGADFVDARHQPSFSVVHETGDLYSPRQVARTREVLERSEYKAEREAENPIFRTVSAGSWSDSADGSWDGSDGSWSDSNGSRSGSAYSERPAQFEDGVVRRGSMEGVLERLLAPGAGQGVHIPRRWKSEMFVMLPASNVLKFWPHQEHGWSAQPPEAFYIEIDSVSSVDLISPLEFQIVYEGRRRLMHLRAATAPLAAAWVDSLRRAATVLETDSDMLETDSCDDELESCHLENERRKDRFGLERQRAEVERQEAAAWEIIEAAAAEHARARQAQELAALDQIAATVFARRGSELGAGASTGAPTYNGRRDRPSTGNELSVADEAQAKQAGLALKALLEKAKSDSPPRSQQGQSLPGSTPARATAFGQSAASDAPRASAAAGMSPKVLESLFDELEAASGGSGTVSSVELLSEISKRFGTEAAAQAKQLIYGTALSTGARAEGAERGESVGRGGMRPGSSTAAAMTAAQSALDRAAQGPSMMADRTQHVQASDTTLTAARSSAYRPRETVPAGTQLPLPPPSRPGPNMPPLFADRAEAAAAASVARHDPTVDSSRGVQTSGGIHMSEGNGVPFLPSPPPLAPPARSNPLTDAELRQVHLRQLHAPADRAVDGLRGMTLGMLSKRAVGSAALPLSHQVLETEVEAETRRQKLQTKLRTENVPLSNQKPAEERATAAADRDNELLISRHQHDEKTAREDSLRKPKVEQEPEPEPELDAAVGLGSARGDGQTLETVSERDDRHKSDEHNDASEANSDSDTVQDDDEDEDEEEHEDREALKSALRPIFEAMDQDESGLLEPDELRFPIGRAVEHTIKLEVASRGGTEKEVQLKMKMAVDLAVSELDADGVGAVDFDDFVSWGTKNLNVVAQLAAHLKVPFVLPNYGKQTAGGHKGGGIRPPKLPSQRVPTAGDISPPAPDADAPDRERGQELPTSSGSKTIVAPSAPLVALPVTSAPTGATGASSAIEERMRLMAQRRKAKARGMSIGGPS